MPSSHDTPEGTEDSSAGPRTTKQRLKAGAGAFALSIGLEILAVALVVDQPVALTCLAAGMIHATAAAVVWFGAGASGSQRELMTALVLTLPLVGVPLAAVALGTQGRGEIQQFIPPEPAVIRSLTSGDVLRLTGGLSSCEALVSANIDQRRSTLAMLKHRADISSIALLRWAIAGPDGDLAMEAAVALEDLNARFEEHAASVRAAADSDSGFDSAVAAADTLAEAIHNGLADQELLPPLTSEARRYYQRSESLAPERLPEIATRWARLELAARCPQAALAVLDRASLLGNNDALAMMRNLLLGDVQRAAPPL